MAHHIPLIPMASRREKVEECSRETGTIVKHRRTMPAVYPSAIPNEDILEVERETAAW
jgi:hypothetical protein